MGIPKAELHIHVEGTIEPEHYLELMARNELPTKYATADAVKERLKYQRDLNTFIEVYEEILSSMVTESDFYEVAMAYYRKVASQGTVYVELFFDPQMHTSRGLSLETVMAGLLRARADAGLELGLEAHYIACFNRDRSAASAMEHLLALVPWKDAILGIGLDNPEEIDFPKKFEAVFQRGRELGFRLTTHCDVNVPNTIAHHWGALDVLKVERIDHGLNVMDEPALIEAVRDRGIGLTACPTLLYLDIPGRIEARVGAVKGLLDADILVSVHSDDPGLMRSLYVGDILQLTQETGELSQAEVVELVKNAFRIAWIPEARKAAYLARVDAWVAEYARKKAE